MGRKKCYLFLFTIIALTLQANAEAETNSSYDAFLASLPAKEQLVFLTVILDEYNSEVMSDEDPETDIESRPSLYRYPFLGKIPDSVFEHIYDLEIPEQFPEKLHSWVKETFGLADWEIDILCMRGMVRKHGHIVTLDHIHELCCPF